MSKKDLFKEAFRYYKKKNPPPNYNQVLDFEEKSYTTISKQIQTAISQDSCAICDKFGLQNHKSWVIHALTGYDGFLYLKNPFTVAGQQMWIKKCLEMYSRKPQITNLDRHYTNVDDIWSLRNSTNETERSYLPKLCWSTLGYHYNWDFKKYDPNHKSDFPDCLKQLAQHIASCLDYKNYLPQAAIINYYNMKSRLGIHSDRFEESLDTPILSFSFGQTGIFLMGTEISTDEPTPMFLRSGDIVVMSRSSRAAYHAVPGIISEDVGHRYASEDNEWSPYGEYMKKARINISVRQVFKNEGQS